MPGLHGSHGLLKHFLEFRMAARNHFIFGIFRGEGAVLGKEAHEPVQIISPQEVDVANQYRFAVSQLAFVFSVGADRR
jgi:hypothetical protein